MQRIFRSTAAMLALLSISGPALAELQGTMYKDPDCPCCEGHAKYLRENGIAIDIKPVDNLAQRSWEAGIPSDYQGCHMIMLDGYVIEGHITVEIIQKLLKQRPADVVGIALPGMPTGVPGMGGPKDELYDVYAIQKNGSVTIFDKE